MEWIGYIGIGILVLLVLLVLVTNIQIVQQSRAYVVERLGDLRGVPRQRRIADAHFGDLGERGLERRQQLALELAVDLLDLRKHPVDLLPVAQALFLCRLSAAGQHRCRFVIYLFWKTHNNPLPVLAPCHLYRLPSSPMNQPSCG